MGVAIVKKLADDETIHDFPGSNNVAFLIIWHFAGEIHLVWRGSQGWLILRRTPTRWSKGSLLLRTPRGSRWSLLLRSRGPKGSLLRPWRTTGKHWSRGIFKNGLIVNKT